MERDFGIPRAFWNFMNQRGVVYQNGRFVQNQPVFDWLYVMGYPVTDAFWTRVRVGNVERDVMFQAFERRVLTYTPSNPIRGRSKWATSASSIIAGATSSKPIDNHAPARGGHCAPVATRGAARHTRQRQREASHMNMLDRSRNAGRGIWTTVVMLVVALLTIGSASLSRASTAQTAGPYKLYLPLVANGPVGADIAVTIRPNPSIRVTKGTRLEYVITVRNYGAGAADVVRVTLPYDNTKLTLRDGRFDTDKGDFVSNVTSSEVTVTFGRVAPGEEHGGSLYFLVNPALADDTVVDMRGTARFDDARGGGDRTTNFAPVIVGSFDNSSPYVFMTVEPVLGPKGTTFRFFSDRFLPGAYTMFFFGERSKLAGAQEFFVDPNP